MKRFFLVLLTVAVAALLIGTALAQGGRGGRRHGSHGMMGDTAAQTQVARGEGQVFGLCTQLTDEQWAEMISLRADLRAEGATPEQIHAAMGEWFTGKGIELPEGWAERPFAGRGRGGFGHFGQRGIMGLGMQLTIEDWQELQALRSSLWEADATPEKVHAAVGDWLTEKGIELPEGWAEQPTFCRIRGGFGPAGLRGAGGPGWRGCWGVSGAGVSPDESAIPDEESMGDQRTSDFKQEVPPTAVEKQSWGEVKKGTKESK